MPKLKSVIAGLALSTAMTGGAVVAGATVTTASASAATQVSTGTSVLTGASCFRARRCGGWGWRRHTRHNRRHINLIIENFNHNRNPQEHRHRHEPRWDRRWWFDVNPLQGVTPPDAGALGANSLAN
ncbi:hypothetical protein [Nonomuraea maritima]|uniref:hypothetical protein n=1 Tax=Nonomuraea maritima TaxID=683260 RepID=UPI003711EC47